MKQETVTNFKSALEKTVAALKTDIMRVSKMFNLKKSAATPPTTPTTAAGTSPASLASDAA